MTRTTIEGTAGDDTLHGTAGADYMKGLAGDDLIYGGAGDDRISGRPGHDSMWGGAGDDLIKAEAPHAVTGGSLLSGGEGDDFLGIYAPGETLNGGAGDTLDGGAGNDEISVLSDPTLVVTLLGGGGDDVVNVIGQIGLADGGAGRDWIDASINIQLDSDLAGLAHGGRMEFSDGSIIQNFETGRLDLSAAADTIHLAAGVQFDLDGNDGDDLLAGNAGDNFIMGGSGLNDGADTLEGRGGADTLGGGSGGDLLIGGRGADVYVYAHVSDSTPSDPDLIVGADPHSIDLSHVDANTKQTGQQHFTIVDALTDQPGQLTVAYSAEDGRTHVSGDVDGDGVADLLILIKGDHTDPGEFVL